ncbi:polysaccharide deacetylase family protein [Angustibacter aerolatus]
MSFSGHAAALRAGSYLHVVNYHWTPASAADQLEADLAAYLRRFDPVTPEHLDHFVDTGRWPLRRPGFAPVFYDSYREQAAVAAPVCESLGIAAWFLPVTGLLDVPPAEQVAWCEQHHVDLPDELPDDGRIGLTWDELAEIGRHHVLGGHTAGHAVPEHTRDPEAVQRELVEPFERLTAIGTAAPAVMAWFEGRLDDPADPAFQSMRDAGFRYLVSATRVQRVR